MDQTVTGFEELSGKPADVGAATDVVLAHIAAHVTVDTFSRVIANSIIQALNGFIGGLPDFAEGVGTVAGKVLVAAEKPVLPLFGAFVTPVLQGLFDSNVDTDAFTNRVNSSGRSDAAAGLVNAFLDAIERDAPAPSEPGMDGSRRLATAAVHAAIEGWFNAFIGENLAEIIPWDWLRIKELTRLPEEVIGALGIGRLVRSAILPLVHATAVEPMRWAANTKYRPTKIGVSTITRALARGLWTEERARAELALEGYSDDRIELLLDENTKFLDIPDVAFSVWQGITTYEEGLAALRDMGFDKQRATDHLAIDRLKREDTVNREIANAAVAAFVEGRIDRGSLDVFLGPSILSEHERVALAQAATSKRALRQIPLSPGEAEACVLAGVLPLADYRTTLEASGRTAYAVDALEILLRKKLDDKLTADEHRAALQAEKAAAAMARAEATATRKADAEAAAAVKRLGSPAELAHAVVRGLIPIARFEQVLAAHFDADTVAIYVADVEAQRQAYLERQQKAADAAKRAAAKGLSTGELQTALVDGVLTADQVRTQLEGKGLDPADVAVLLATMQDTAAAHVLAVQTRDAAVRKAKNHPVDLAKAEQLVRAGHWTLAQYNSLLASLGFTDAAQADLDALLQDQIAKDKAARSVRAGVTTTAPAKGLSLVQARQAVILGVHTLDWFQTFLVHEGYTADAMATLVAELRDAVAAADAARARRAATPGASDGRTVALAEVTKAARLGVITPAAYHAELVARHFAPHDLALEMDLLLTELAATRAVQARRPAATAAPGATGLSLAQLATAVKAGEASIDAYRARAVQLGYAPADVQTLTDVLADEVSTLAFATQRHTTIAGELTLRGVSMADREAAVTAGTMTLDDYEQWLQTAGYSPADAALQRALLASKRPSPSGP